MFETKSGTIKPIVYVGIIRDQKLLLVDYKNAPNPAKTGWWIPAPGLNFGADPTETATTVLSELGFAGKCPRLHQVESFVLPGGWHLIYHFVCEVQEDASPNESLNAIKWVSAQELASMTDIAHGKWEINIGQSYMEQAAKQEHMTSRQ